MEYGVVREEYEKNQTRRHPHPHDIKALGHDFNALGIRT